MKALLTKVFIKDIQMWNVGYLYQDVHSQCQMSQNIFMVLKCTLEESLFKFLTECFWKM